MLKFIFSVCGQKATFSPQDQVPFEILFHTTAWLSLITFAICKYLPYCLDDDSISDSVLITWYLRLFGFLLLCVKLVMCGKILAPEGSQRFAINSLWWSRFYSLTGFFVCLFVRFILFCFCFFFFLEEKLFTEEED